MNNFFCHLPFFSVDTNGVNARPCCVIKLDTPVSLDGYTDSTEIKNIKKLLLNKQAPHQCNSCVVNESTSGFSFRTLANQFHPHLTDEALQMNDSQYDLRFVNLVGSNVCNLKCLPCENGSFIRRKELYDLGLVKYFPISEQNSWIGFEKIPMEKLTITAGEPFYNKGVMALVNRLVDNGQSNQIEIDINTNLTHITRDTLELLANNFKSVIIKGSIDGIGAVNDYLRYPSSWKDIDSAVKLIQSFPEISFVVTTALSNLSLIKYYEVVNWALDNNIADLFISQVTTPAELNCNLLPNSLKEKLLSTYQALRKSVAAANTSKRTLQCLDMCITLCQNRTQSTVTFNDTLNWLKLHDNHRHTSVLTVFPELDNLIDLG